MEATALFTLSFLFLSFTANYGVYARRGISILDKEPPAVLDINGDKLQKGQEYYLLPSIPLPFLYTAAFIPGIYRPGTTWFQLEIEVFTYGIKGLPVTFSPTNLNEDASIHVSTYLNIKYSNELPPVFGESPVWKVPEGFEQFVTLGGVEGDKSSWFKIEKASEIDNRIYKLVSSSGRDVGISSRTYGTKRLALADEALGFSFLPAKDDSTSK